VREHTFGDVKLLGVVAVILDSHTVLVHRCFLSKVLLPRTPRLGPRPRRS
jgi:hypothetical protein